MLKTLGKCRYKNKKVYSHFSRISRVDFKGRKMKKTNLVLGFMLIMLLVSSTSLLAVDQVVDNNADAGVGTTLREAIAAVHNGETITFNISDSDVVTN